MLLCPRKSCTVEAALFLTPASTVLDSDGGRYSCRKIYSEAVSMDMILSLGPGFRIARLVG